MREPPLRTRPGSRVTTARSAGTRAARLDLLEYFLAHHDDPYACAHESLAWLARHAGITRSVCLALNGESTGLVGLAGHGVRPGQVEALAVPLASGGRSARGGPSVRGGVRTRRGAGQAA